MSSLTGTTFELPVSSGFRIPAYTRAAPACTNESTTARPIPRLAPVTNTTLPSSFIHCLCLCSEQHHYSVDSHITPVRQSQRKTRRSAARVALPVAGQTRSQEDTPPTEEVGQLDTRAGLLCLLLLLHESVEDSSGCEAGAVHGEMDE